MGRVLETTVNDIRQRYIIRKKLGEGRFSEVMLGESVTTKELVGVKVVDRATLEEDEEAMEAMQAEIAMCKQVDHPNVVILKEVVKTPTTLYLIMELCEGGELFDRIVDKGKYPEEEAKVLIARLVGALAYLHDLGIVHRDLKPENLLFQSKRDDAEIKIIDFGYAGFYTAAGLTGLCGTPDYVAPEVLSWYAPDDRIVMGTPYGKPCDMWSIGVIVYILLCGFPPFYAEDEDALLRLVQAGKFSFPVPHWNGISTQAKRFIKQCLDVDMETRLTAVDALQHPWIADVPPLPAANAPAQGGKPSYVGMKGPGQGQKPPGPPQQAAPSGPSLAEEIKRSLTGYLNNPRVQDIKIGHQNLSLNVQPSSIRYEISPNVATLKNTPGATLLVVPDSTFEDIYKVCEFYKQAKLGPHSRNVKSCDVRGREDDDLHSMIERIAQNPKAVGNVYQR